MSDKMSDVAKRRAKRRKIARKRHLRVALVLFLLFAVFIGAVLSVTVLFPVKNITASGSRIYDEKIIIANCGVKGKNLFTLSETKITENLRKELPFVSSVKIKRKMPDTVNLQITDAKEYFCFKQSGRYFSASNDGYVLKEYAKKPKNTVEIKAEINDISLGKKVTYKHNSAENTLKEIKIRLEEKNIAMDYIDVSDMNDIKVGVEKRFKVLMGTKSYLDKKCAHLNGMIKKINKKEKGTINLSMWTPSKSEGTFIKNKKG